MVLQEELQLALFKTPSGESLFLDRVSVYYAFLFVNFFFIKRVLTTTYTYLSISPLIILKIFTWHAASIDNDMKLRLSP